MKKFNLADYNINNIGTIFDLVVSPETEHITYRVRLSVIGNELSLTDMGGNLFNHYEVPYLKNVHNLYTAADQRCGACNNHSSPIEGIFNDRMLCKRHYNNEIALARMSIRDFLFKIENQSDYDIFKENYHSYVHNGQDLKFPCFIVLHREMDYQYDEFTYTYYIINQDMGVVK